MATNLNMLVNEDTLENLLITEVTRLHEDQSTLERLRDMLPQQQPHSSLESRFLSLWDDIEARAGRVERLLDRMSLGAKPPDQVVCIAPQQLPPAA